MFRLLGILLIVAGLYALLVGSFDAARSVDNHVDLARRLGFYGVLTLGVGTLIIAGGIDLSIGSLVGLSAVSFGMLLERQTDPWLAAGIVLMAAPCLGLIHGLLVTRLGLPPFLVTLCGLFVYRGVARWMSRTTVGLAVGAPAEYRDRVQTLVDLLVKGRTFGVPHILWLLLALALLLGVFLHLSVYGRYLFATGANEQAARYSGIRVERFKVLAYVICSAAAGLGGVLFLPMYSSANPASAGSLLELYAITGAVLGGCALRGGEGTVPGMLLGAAVLPLLNKLCNLSDRIGSDLEYAVVGIALLAGSIINEVIARKD
ncbi:MAG: ABC transporter permease [Gemmataceae bacterium]|nr:ABC transporter permease [Gemmataceae bacterium]